MATDVQYCWCEQCCLAHSLIPKPAKPATAEPPEWATTISPGEYRRIDPDKPLIVEPSHLDRALSDFIERRKAKREVRHMKPPKWKYDKARRTLVPIDPEPDNAKDAPAISRAMLTPITFTARMGGR